MKFSLKKIRSLYESGFAVPFIKKRRSGPPPWELYQRIYSKSPFSFFLDSLGYNPPAQRYSYLGSGPYLKLIFEDGKLRFFPPHPHPLPPRGRGKGEGEISFLKELRKIFRAVRTPPGFSSDFFTGGAVGYWGYELAEAFESISFRKKKGPSFPKLVLLFFRDLIVFDHKEGCYFLISWLLPEKNLSFSQALRRAGENLEEMEEAFSAPPEVNGRNGNGGNGARHLGGAWHLLNFRPEISRSGFEKMVRKAQSYIAAGDIYQANLSQRFSFEFEGSPLVLYGRLRETNPAPYSAVLHLDDLFIASSSPELLVAKNGTECVTCPIAGTRPRGRNENEARHLARELLASEKERAEHLMLVDLERNDLGRVSEWKSVRVKDFMRLEKYARVIHIVSEITGRLRPPKDAWDLIQSMFPGGTITGCPKIRSMEIIDELEPVERGVYTGSIGYVGFDGNLMLNIAIRTFVLLKNQGHLQVGAGIVADSDPAREYEETLAKGEALAEALIQACA